MLAIRHQNATIYIICCFFSSTLKKEGNTRVRISFITNLVITQKCVFVRVCVCVCVCRPLSSTTLFATTSPISVPPQQYWKSLSSIFFFSNYISKQIVHLGLQSRISTIYPLVAISTKDFKKEKKEKKEKKFIYFFFYFISFSLFSFGCYYCCLSVVLS